MLYQIVGKSSSLHNIEIAYTEPAHIKDVPACINFVCVKLQQMIQISLIATTVLLCITYSW